MNLSIRALAAQRLPKDTAARAQKTGKRLVHFVAALLRFCLLFGLGFIILYPIAYMISLTFREPAEMLDPTVVWIPKTFTLDNIKQVYSMLGYTQGAIMSAVLSLSCTVLQCFTCSLAGYGLARFKFRGRTLFFFVAIFTLIVPPQSIMMPTYINYANFTAATGIPILDTAWSLILPALFGAGLRSGLFIFIFRQFYRNMPGELEEAAYIDGCKPIAAYWRVIFPNTGAVLLTAFIFSLVWYWNDYFNVSLYFNNARPLSVLVGTFSDFLYTARNEQGQAFTAAETLTYLQTACLLFITPVLVLYAFLQKYFTQSVVRSGIVG